MSEPTVRAYVPHSGRTGYSVVSADQCVAYMVTPEYGPGQFSPVTGWEVWKSDALNVRRTFAGTEAGRLRAIEYAKEVAQ